MSKADSKFLGYLDADDPADFMAKMLTSVEAQIDEDGWDKPNQMWLVFGEYLETAAGPTAAAIRVVRMPLPDEARSGRPGYALQTLAMGLRTMPGMRDNLMRGFGAPGQLIAVVFSTETWCVTGLAEEEVDTWRGRFHEHPDRTETRCLWATDLHGNRYGVTRTRGEDPIPDRPNAIRGEVPDAIDAIMASLRRPAWLG